MQPHPSVVPNQHEIVCERVRFLKRTEQTWQEYYEALLLLHLSWKLRFGKLPELHLEFVRIQIANSRVVMRVFFV